MPYFVILPVFASAIALGGLAILLCAAIPTLRKAVPYGWRMLVGSTLGFLSANLASILLGVIPVLCAGALGIGADDPGARLVAGFALLGLFFGPLVVSPIGFLGGAWLGFRRARRARLAPA